MLVLVYEGDDTDSLSQREAICFSGLNLELGQTHSNCLQPPSQLWQQILLIQPHNLIWFYSRCSVHSGSMAAKEQKGVGHRDLALSYACMPEPPKRLC